MSQKQVTGIRLDDTLEQRLAEAVERSNMPKADVIRLALDQGLRDLADINFDVAGAIHARVKELRAQSAMLNDGPAYPRP